MSQLKVNAIRATAASSDAITLATDGTCTAKITNNLSNRNLIINGGMAVAQRGTTSTGDDYTTVDRFRVSGGGHDEATTKAQVALTSSDTGPWAKGFRYALQITNGNQTSGAQTGDYAYISYRPEAQDIAQSGWDYNSASSYLTLSFWVKSSVAQNFYGYVLSADGTQQSFPFETGSLSANTWKKVTVKMPGHANITVDNDNGHGLEILLWPFLGTDYTASGVSLNAWAAYASASRTPDFTSTWWTTNDATFSLTGVQLEVGDVATDFEHRSYGDELLRCLRYFYKTSATGANWKRFMQGRAHDVNTARFMMDAPVPFRTVPTATYSGNFQTQGGTYTANPAVESITSDNRQLCFTTGNSGDGWSTNDALEYMANDDTSASISFSAEL